MSTRTRFATKRGPHVRYHLKQGHHHNGDHAARRPHMMFSICGRRFTTSRFGGSVGWGCAHLIARPWVPITLQLPTDTYGLSNTVFELFSWLKKAFPPVRPGYDNKYRSRSYRFVQRKYVRRSSLKQTEISLTLYFRFVAGSRRASISSRHFNSNSLYKQGHYHNGDQAARRPHMMCSICGRRFTTPLFGVSGDWDELIRQPAHVFLLALR